MTIFTYYFIEEFPTFLLACKRYFDIKDFSYDLFILISFITFRFFHYFWMSYKLKEIIQESYLFIFMFYVIGILQTKWCFELLQKNISKIPFGVGKNNENKIEFKKTETIVSKTSKPKLPFSEISFHSSGWMKIFEYGVTKYIQENYDTSCSEIIGTSAGALVACTLCCDIPIDVIYDEIIATRNRSSNPFFMCKNAKRCIQKFLPKNCIELINNRLTIICSGFTKKGLVRKEYRHFKTYTDVLLYLNATVHLPFLDGILPEGEDLLYDGMMTDSHPQTHESCLKITWDKTCYCGCTKTKNSIFPDIQIPDQWLFLPPNEYTLSLLYQHGYYCAKRYFLKNTIEDDDLNKEIVLSLMKTIENNNINNTLYLFKGSFLFAMCIVVSQCILHL
jgi:hypothetical protein